MRPKYVPSPVRRKSRKSTRNERRITRPTQRQRSPVARWRMTGPIRGRMMGVHGDFGRTGSSETMYGHTTAGRDGWQHFNADDDRTRVLMLTCRRINARIHTGTHTHIHSHTGTATHTHCSRNTVLRRQFRGGHRGRDAIVGKAPRAGRSGRRRQIATERGNCCVNFDEIRHLPILCY